ncbi:MAG: hypothetical protein COB17_02380 [Sulfurimonas sp.]|nr:MAG: hypothetical protein COB17_02380 [Sulfurimonas sp.]
MKNITDIQIKQHIIKVVDNELEFDADRYLMSTYKDKILGDKNEGEIDYIAKLIIDDMDRHLLNIEKTNFNINQLDLSSFIDYLKMNFPLKEYLKEAIENNHYQSFICSENCNEILNANLLISSIVRSLHILNLVKEDVRLNLAKKENMLKVENAISTLLNYTNDKQIEYYLKTMNLQERDITVSTIQSCIFCDLYKTLEEMLSSLNKSKIEEITVMIMEQVFDSRKEYRYYKNTEQIIFKGYKLRKFKANKNKYSKFQ